MYSICGHVGVWSCTSLLWYLNIYMWPTVELITHQDDEYVWAGVEDPKVVITTSHNPSSRLKQFAKVSVVLLCT